MDSSNIVFAIFIEEDIQPTYLTIYLPTNGLNGPEFELINYFKNILLKHGLKGV